MTDPKKCTCVVCNAINSLPPDINSNQIADIMLAMLIAYGVTPESAVAILQRAAQGYADAYNAKGGVVH